MRSGKYRILAVLLVIASFISSCARDDVIIDTESIPSEPITLSYDIKYYDIVQDLEITVTETKTFDEAPTCEYFIDRLSELSGIHIGYNYAKLNEDTATVDFKSGSCPVSGTGAYEESILLDNIAQLIFEVFPNIEQIYYTADDKDYNSGHVSLEKGIPYAERTEKEEG